MNNTLSTPPWTVDALQTRFARRVAARLEQVAMQTPPDIEERLRFARERALERAREAARLTAVTSNGAGTLLLSGTSSWWVRLASLVPLILLIGGLTLIHERHWQAQIQAAAEIDAAILGSDLPPAAYSDPGFVEYLKVLD